MKKIILLSTCLSLVVCMSFGQAKSPTAAKVKAIEDTIQYSLGIYMMDQLTKTGFKVNNPIMFKKAIDDMIAGKKPMVDQATAVNNLLAYQAVYQRQRNIQIEALLFSKIKGQGFTELPTGVNYSISTPGTGITPAAKDTVIMNVITTLPDGTVVDDTNKSKQSYMAIAGDMIPGLKDVLFRMREGGIARAIIPASQAYGAVGTPSIPPNSAVIYDIALVKVKPAR
jgi:FKBP-type peptidyl-prolyl cis-trans isomerase